MKRFLSLIAIPLLGACAGNSENESISQEASSEYHSDPEESDFPSYFDEATVVAYRAEHCPDVYEQGDEIRVRQTGDTGLVLRGGYRHDADSVSYWGDRVPEPEAACEKIQTVVRIRPQGGQYQEVDFYDFEIAHK